MEITGTVCVVCNAQSGVSERTGNAWMAQTYVLEVTSGDHGQYKKKFAFEVFGEERIKQFNLSVGRQVKVFFDIEASEYEGKWYNRIRAYAVENAVGQQQPYMPQYNQQPSQQQGYRPQQQQGGYQQQQRPPQNGFYQPVQQGYPQPQGYYQPVQQQQPQQGTMPFPPQVDPVTGEPLPF